MTDIYEDNSCTMKSTNINSLLHPITTPFYLSTQVQDGEEARQSPVQYIRTPPFLITDEESD